MHRVSYFFGILKHFSGAVGEGVGDGLEEMSVGHVSSSPFRNPHQTQGGRRSHHREDRRSGQRMGGQGGGEGAPQGGRGAHLQEGLLKGTGVGGQA